MAVIGVVSRIDLGYDEGDALAVWGDGHVARRADPVEIVRLDRASVLSIRVGGGGGEERGEQQADDGSGAGAAVGNPCATAHRNLCSCGRGSCDPRLAPGDYWGSAEQARIGSADGTCAGEKSDCYSRPLGRSIGQ